MYMKSGGLPPPRHPPYSRGLLPPRPPRWGAELPRMKQGVLGATAPPKFMGMCEIRGFYKLFPSQASNGAFDSMPEGLCKWPILIARGGPKRA